MRLVSPLPLLLLALSSSSVHAHGLNHDPAMPTSAQADVVSTVQPSPECWMEAMKAMQQLQHDASNHDRDTPSLGSVVCSNMSHDHKKALALELARCQMQDLGRPLFEHSELNTTSCNRPILDSTNLHACLMRMTTAGVHAYSLFFTHVHQSCTRLTQEHLMQASQVASQQLLSTIEKQSQQWASHQEEHSTLLQQLYTVVQERQEDFQELRNFVKETTKTIQPLLRMEALFNVVTNGVTWLTSFAFTLILWIVVWMFSKRYTRRIMFRLVCMEGLLEFGLHWMVSQGLVGDSERARGIAALRRWTLVAEGFLYVVGLIASLFCREPRRRRRRRQDEVEASEQMVEMMHMVANNSERLRKETQVPVSPPQQQRFVEVVVPRALHNTVPVEHYRHGLVYEPANETTSSANNNHQLALPPMYQEVSRPSIRHNGSTYPPPPPSASQARREISEQDYAAAVLVESLRRVLAESHQQQPYQAPPPYPSQQPHFVDSPQTSSTHQQVPTDGSNDHDPEHLTVDKVPKKRCLEENEDDESDDDEEPERKRARTQSN